MSALSYLLKREWSMGNGQCPDCCGVPASWHGHILHLTTRTIGHRNGCALAAAIKDAGGKPLFMGQFKSELQYEQCMIPNGGLNIISTQLKGSNPVRRKLYENAAFELASMQEATMRKLFSKD